MSIWYYTNKNGEKVQITGGQLKGLAKAGLIKPETIVETENGKSAPAGKVKGLTFGTVPLPETVKPIVSRPFTVPMPTVNQAIDQSVPQSVATPVAVEGKSSLLVTIIGIVAILTVSGIGWSVIEHHDRERQETIAKAERERIAVEEQERERIAVEEQERERIAAEEREQQRIVAEEQEQERMAAEEQEQKREQEAAAREQAAKEQAARAQAAREQAAREQAVRAQAARERAAREQAAKEQAASLALKTVNGRPIELLGDKILKPEAFDNFLPPIGGYGQFDDWYRKSRNVKPSVLYGNPVLAHWSLVNGILVGRNQEFNKLSPEKKTGYLLGIIEDIELRIRNGDNVNRVTELQGYKSKVNTKILHVERDAMRGEVGRGVDRSF